MADLIAASPGVPFIPDIINTIGDVVTSPGAAAVGAVGSTFIDMWAKAIMEAAGATLIYLGTWWVRVDVPLVIGGDSPVGWVQERLNWAVIAVLIGSIIAAGMQIAWSRRAEGARELVKSLLTMIVVTTAGTLAASYLIEICDEFATWILNEVTNNSAQDFGSFIVKTALDPIGGSTARFLMIVLGLVAVIANLIQMGLILIRSALLPVLVAVLPFSAAATNTTWGRQWFQKTTAWFVAFALYKPAAAIIYALAIKMTASGVGDGGEFEQFAIGLFLMIAATLALPALIGFMVPAVQTIGSSGGGAGGSLVASGMLRASGSRPTPSPSSSSMSASSASGSATTSTVSSSTSAGTAGTASTASASAGPIGAVVGVGVDATLKASDAVKSVVSDEASGAGEDKGA